MLAGVSHNCSRWCKSRVDVDDEDDDDDDDDDGVGLSIDVIKMSAEDNEFFCSSLQVLLD